MISLEYDVKAFVNLAKVFLRSSIGSRKAIVGISGGLDSATVAYLLVEAIGKEQVLGVLMHEQQDEDFEDAMLVVKRLGIEYVFEPLRIPERLRSEDRVALGNVKARLRMITLYKLANELNGIVVGTSNKSELMVGYFTKRGDGAADIYPIGDLYKTQVYKLAEYLGVPERIIKKRPSAGLRPGQYDEEELGISYETLDKILKGFELLMRPEEIAQELGIELDKVLYVRSLIMRSRHKRWKKILRVSMRSPSFDRREPAY